MAIEVIYLGEQYTLRTAGPMPVYGGQGGGIPRYVVHTFGADVSQIDIYDCTDSLPSSDEFRGQGGDLMNASFSRLGDVSGNMFQGRAVHAPVFQDEPYSGFNNF